MKTIWIITAMEFRLYLRGKTRWLLVAFLAFSSLYFLYQAYLSHIYASNFWTNMGIAYLLLTFVLAFSTGSQIQRDRDCRLDSIILSSPVSTTTYVCGKYLASLLVILVLALMNLLVTIAGDLWLPTAGGAVIGPWPYVASWGVLVLVPLLFGAAFTLFVTTFTHGQRVVTGLLIFFLWVTPVIIDGQSGKNYPLVNALNVSGWFVFSTDAPAMAGRTLHEVITPSSARQMAQLVQTHIPWDHLTATMWLNRSIFLALAILCFLGAIASLHRQRRGSTWLITKSHRSAKKGTH